MEGLRGYSNQCMFDLRPHRYTQLRLLYRLATKVISKRNLMDAFMQQYELTVCMNNKTNSVLYVAISLGNDISFLAYPQCKVKLRNDYEKEFYQHLASGRIGR